MPLAAEVVVDVQSKLVKIAEAVMKQVIYNDQINQGQILQSPQIAHMFP